MKIKSSYILSIIVFILNIVLSQLFYSANNSFVLSTVLIIIDIISIGLIFYTKTKDKKIYFIIFTSLIIRTLLMYFELYGRNIFVLPNSGADTEAFYLLSQSRNFSEVSGYYLFVKILSILFKNQRLLFQFINVIFSIIVDLIILKILNLLKIKEKTKIFAFSLLCFLPSNMIISVELLREELMILLNTISLYYLINWYVKNKNYYFVISVVFILLSSYFHSSMIVAILAYFIIYILYNRKKEKLIINKKSFLYLCIVLLVSFIIYKFIFPYVSGYFESISDLESINKKMSYYVDGGSGYLQNLAYNTSYLSLIMTSPIKFIYFFASPMPWDWRGINDILTFIFSSLFYIYTYISFIKCRSKNVLIKSLFLIITIVGFTYGMSCFSAGSAMRHREKVFTYAILLIAYVKSKKESGQNEV